MAETSGSRSAGAWAAGLGSTASRQIGTGAEGGRSKIDLGAVVVKAASSVVLNCSGVISFT